MKLVTVGEFKAHFSDMLELVENNEEIGITFGKKKEPIAKLIPFKKKTHPPIKLGLFKDMASIKFSKDFKFKSVDEFLNLE